MTLSVFVMPHYAEKDDSLCRDHVVDSIASILCQTDSNWKLIIVDDASTNIEALAAIDAFQVHFPDRISIIYNSENEGPGICRNLCKRRLRRYGPFIKTAREVHVSE